MSNEEIMPRSYMKVPFAKSVARLMRLATPAQRGETNLQGRRRIAKSIMITRPVVYDEAPARYYATPNPTRAHALIPVCQDPT